MNVAYINDKNISAVAKAWQRHHEEICKHVQRLLPHIGNDEPEKEPHISQLTMELETMLEEMFTAGDPSPSSVNH